MSGTTEHVEAAADRTEDRARAARTWSELTKAQRKFLWWARYWTGRDGCVGCGASGSTVHAAEVLLSRKLVTDEGMCVDTDDHSKPERPTYGITPWGRLVVSIGDEPVRPIRKETP